MHTKEKIIKLRKLIEEEIYLHNSKRIHEVELNQLISSINQDLLINYETQREFISQFLYVYEINGEHVVDILFHRFVNGLENLKQLSIVPLDLNFWEGEFDIDAVSKEYKSFLKEKMTEVKEIRLSNNLDFIIDKNVGG